MLESIVPLIAGLLLLFFGKRLFWLAGGLVAFLFGYQLFGNLFGVGWSLFIGLILGIIFAWLAIKFIKMAVYILAFLGGAIALPFLVGKLGFDLSWLVLILIGGAIGLILVAVAFDWGLIFITAWAGASAIIFGIRQWISLDGTIGMLIFLVIMAVGIYWQAIRQRK